MLAALSVENYVLIDSLETEFPAGLVIITGQTGAGKSILLGALGLALGAKADQSVIGPSSDKCIVEARFKVDSGGAVGAILSENDIEAEGGEIVVRRVLSRSGRSRCFVNDEPVPSKVLSDLSGHLVDVHSQHDTLLLKDRQWQMDVLDAFAGNSSLREECSVSYRHLRALEKEKEEVSKKLSDLSLQKDFNESILGQLKDASLREGELEELEAEEKVLSNAEDIKDTLLGVESSLQGGDETPSVDVLLKECARSLSRLSSYLPDAEGLSSRLESARVEIEDILSEVQGMEEGVSLSRDRLSQVEERLSTLYTLLRKHSCQSVADLIAKRDSLSSEMYDSDALSERLESLEKEIEGERRKYDDICSRLSSSRKKSAPFLAKAIQDDIRSLELERSVFEIEISQGTPSERGFDSILMKFSSTGKNPVDVARCASGGELSRIMLCLKAIMARYSQMPSMVFDEIDTGVSGSTADKIGRKVCAMGADMQVFAITHLPQVAAKGDAHYLVEKTVDAQGGRTTVKKITGEDHVMEIARMLSGSSITPEAVANARALISQRG